MNDEQMMKPGALTGLVLIAALLAGLSYWVSSRTAEPSALMTVWKGAGVGLLALWAAMQARSSDGWLIALVMACGAAGDVLLETHGLIVGAVAFLAGHIVAILLYGRNRREKLVASQRALALLLVPVTVFIAWSLPSERADALGIAVYTFFLAAMAAMAWTSRFSRYTAGIGAMLFVISDLLIFARIGPLAESPLPGLLIWPCYFTGQALIAIGVVRTLAADRAGQAA